MNPRNCGEILLWIVLPKIDESPKESCTFQAHELVTEPSISAINVVLSVFLLTIIFNCSDSYDKPGQKRDA
jgi:hypothetical protein